MVQSTLKGFKTTDLKRLSEECGKCNKFTTSVTFSTYADVVLSRLSLQVDELVVHAQPLGGCMKHAHRLAQILVIYCINIELQRPVSNNTGD